MLWGSKRTGPDLARLGGKYSDDWHVAHLIGPRSVVPASIMPAYPWLARTLDTGLLPDSLATLARLGVPYDDAMVAAAEADALGQSRPDSDATDGFRERYGERPPGPCLRWRSFAADGNGCTDSLPAVAWKVDGRALSHLGGGQPMTHDILVYLAKTVGLIWLMGFFLIVVIRAYSPSRRKAYDAAARSILPEERDGHE
jgi:cbb3-type cytochrome oxidase subunit 3